MLPILLRIGPVTIYSFGVMAMLGFLVPALLLRREFIRTKLDPEYVNSIVIAAILAGFGGARLYYIFEHWSRFVRDPLSLIFTGAGLAWFGGFFGAAAAVYWVIRRNKLPLGLTADLIAPMLVLGYAFGRLGCLLSGDGDYGPPTRMPWGMSFPNGAVPTHLNPHIQQILGTANVPIDIKVHPTPLYEILMLLPLFYFLWRRRLRPHPAGAQFSLYLVLIGAERFIAEFWRMTPRVFGTWLSVPQLYSLIVILAGVALLARVYRRGESVAAVEPSPRRRRQKAAT